MSDRPWSQPDNVSSLLSMGSKWGNENRGGFYFRLVSLMPGDIDYFIVGPMDLGLELFFTQVLTAISNNRQIEVHYEKGFETETPGKYAGDVIAIRLR